MLHITTNATPLSSLPAWGENNPVSVRPAFDATCQAWAYATTICMENLHAGLMGSQAALLCTKHSKLHGLDHHGLDQLLSSSPLAEWSRSLVTFLSQVL